MWVSFQPSAKLGWERIPQGIRFCFLFVSIGLFSATLPFSSAFSQKNKQILLFLRKLNKTDLSLWKRIMFFLIYIAKLLFAAAHMRFPSVPYPSLLFLGYCCTGSPSTSHTLSAEPGHLAALVSLIKYKCDSHYAGSLGVYQLNGDADNALLLTVSEAARSSVLLDGWNLEEQHQSSSAAGAMSLPFRKELEKYKNINEDEILSKLSEDELKQLEHVLDDLDPEVSNGNWGWGGVP